MMKAFYRTAAIATLTLSSLARAEGDAAQGQMLFQSRCIACHSIDAHRVGPALGGVFGRRAGSAPGYQYSPAVRASGVVWNAQTLERWLTNPEALIPGQRMGYSVPDPMNRSDLIAYIRAASPAAQRP